MPPSASHTVGNGTNCSDLTGEAFICCTSASLADISLFERKHFNLGGEIHACDMQQLQKTAEAASE